MIYLRRKICQWQHCYWRSHWELSCWQLPVQSATYAAFSTPTFSSKFCVFETLYKNMQDVEIVSIFVQALWKLTGVSTTLLFYSYDKLPYRILKRTVCSNQPINVGETFKRPLTWASSPIDSCYQLHELWVLVINIGWGKWYQPIRICNCK